MRSLRVRLVLWAWRRFGAGRVDPDGQRRIEMASSPGELWNALQRSRFLEAAAVSSYADYEAGEDLGRAALQQRPGWRTAEYAWRDEWRRAPKAHRFVADGGRPLCGRPLRIAADDSVRGRFCDRCEDAA
jgi:hypothetical protein